MNEMWVTITFPDAEARDAARISDVSVSMSARRPQVDDELQVIAVARQTAAERIIHAIACLDEHDYQRIKDAIRKWDEEDYTGKEET